MLMFIKSAAIAAMISAGAAAPAAAATDVTPPTVPQNAHVSAMYRGQPVISWDPSTDDSGSIAHYWVLVDGHQRARPQTTTYKIDTLVQLDRITPGPHVITIQAVDPSLNRSAPSNSVPIVVS
ncbi:fibronectin type III domain-containing protein [Nonomuraea sp. NPDC003707]